MYKNNFYQLHSMFKANHNRLSVPMVRLFGTDVAVMLSELYSEFRTSKLRRGDSFQSSVDWVTFNTGLSASKQRKCIKKLVEYGLIDCSVFGFPKHRYIRFLDSGIEKLKEDLSKDKERLDIFKEQQKSKKVEFERKYSEKIQKFNSDRRFLYSHERVIGLSPFLNEIYRSLVKDAEGNFVEEVCTEGFDESIAKTHLILDLVSKELKKPEDFQTLFDKYSSYQFEFQPITHIDQKIDFINGECPQFDLIRKGVDYQIVRRTIDDRKFIAYVKEKTDDFNYRFRDDYKLEIDIIGDTSDLHLKDASEFPNGRKIPYDPNVVREEVVFNYPF